MIERTICVILCMELYWEMFHNMNMIVLRIDMT